MDSKGATWIADAYFGGKGKSYGLTTCPTTITTTPDDALYCAQRYFDRTVAAPYVYSIPVSVAGYFQVRLHFGEIVRWRYNGVLEPISALV